MKIVHLHHCSRAAMGITQGLIEAKFDIKIDHDYYSKGRLVLKKSNTIKDNIVEADIVLMNDSEFYFDFIEQKNMWNKVIFYDYRDNTTPVERMLCKCILYFKRSLLVGNERKPVSLQGMTPIHHCALEEYYSPPVEKQYDIGCFFDLNNPNIGLRRKLLTETLLQSGVENSLIGKSTAFGKEARLAISKEVEDNPFYEFLDLQRCCKIIFTAQPELVEGDNRTWESFASGALVFRDRWQLPPMNEPQDGVHCIVYDATDCNSIKAAIQKAKYYLLHDEERISIARCGYEYVRKNHRPINRVKQMLFPITKALL